MLNGLGCFGTCTSSLNSVHACDMIVVFMNVQANYGLIGSYFDCPVRMDGSGWAGRQHSWRTSHGPTYQTLKHQPALAGASQPNGLKVKKRKIKILI